MADAARSIHPARARAGAAMVEAVAAVPVLFALLVAVMYLQQLHRTKLATLQTARSCALLHAAGGCASPPAGCGGGVGEVARNSDRAADAILAEVERTNTGSSFDVLERVPLLGDAIAELFGTTTLVVAERRMRAPGNVSEPLVITAGMRVLCNARPSDVLAAAKATVCSSLDAIDFLDLCGDDR